MDVTEALIRPATEHSTTQTPDQDNIFAIFRRVFDADRCAHRLVYWVDEKFGRTIVRQRLAEHRQAKKDDRILTTFAGDPDLDLLRLLICNVNAGRLLTGVRWEIYRDFDCTDLMTRGRFDHIDLLGGMNQAQIEEIARTGNITVPSRAADLDFDALVLTHTCPRCKQLYGKGVLVFEPEIQQCDSCQHNYRSSHDAEEMTKTLGETLAIAHQLVALVTEKRSDVLPVTDSTALMDVERLLDIHATPVFCLIFSKYLAFDRLDSPEIRCKPPQASLSTVRITTCYERSIFNLLRIPLFHKAFFEFMCARYERLLTEAHREPPPALSHLDPGMTQGVRLNHVHESRESFIQDMEAIRTFHDWFFASADSCRHMSPEAMRADINYRRRIREAVKNFPGYIEEALTEIDRQLTEQARTC